MENLTNNTDTPKISNTDCGKITTRKENTIRKIIDADGGDQNDGAGNDVVVNMIMVVLMVIVMTVIMVMTVVYMVLVGEKHKILIAY